MYNVRYLYLLSFSESTNLLRIALVNIILLIYSIKIRQILSFFDIKFAFNIFRKSLLIKMTLY